MRTRGHTRPRCGLCQCRPSIRRQKAQCCSKNGAVCISDSGAAPGPPSGWLDRRTRQGVEHWAKPATRCPDNQGGGGRDSVLLVLHSCGRRAPHAAHACDGRPLSRLHSPHTPARCTLPPPPRPLQAAAFGHARLPGQRLVLSLPASTALATCTQRRPRCLAPLAAPENGSPGPSAAAAPPPSAAPPPQEAGEDDSLVVPERMTTWQYGKTRDAGLAPFYIAMMWIVPMLLIVAPFLPLPKM